MCSAYVMQLYNMIVKYFSEENYISESVFVINDNYQGWTETTEKSAFNHKSYKEQELSEP